MTLLAERHGERWFPNLFLHSDGSLLLYVGFGHDRAFAPVYRLRSTDRGKTWLEEQENVPRLGVAHSFADGELLEIDVYSVREGGVENGWMNYGAWSIPGSTEPARKEFVKIHSPSIDAPTLAQGRGAAYPTYPWWDLFNTAVGKTEVRGGDIVFHGAVLTDICEADGRLLAPGYASSREDMEFYESKEKRVRSVFCYESRDRGKTWNEIGMIGRGDPDMPEGFNEASLTLLADGSLYSIMRTGGILYQSWSPDGRTWSTPVPMPEIQGSIPRLAWPRCIRTRSGSLVAAYGRPGKKLIIDRSGTGHQWELLFDLHQWELETQELMGVPEDRRLRGDTGAFIRYWDSSDYLSVVEGPEGDDSLYVTYDVQNYLEHWNAHPVSGVRFVRLQQY